MKKLLFLLFLPILSTSVLAQNSHKILLAGVARMNISKLKIQDPTSSRKSFQPTTKAYTPGFGIAIQPLYGKIFHLFIQVAYEERGSAEAYYFSTSTSNDFLHIYDRFRCCYTDILVRAENKKEFYAGIGGSICKPIKGYYRKNNSSLILPPGSILHEPTEISNLTYGITVAAGKNFSGKAEAEINSTWDVSPVIDRTDARVFIWAGSFTIRYYFIRPDEKNE